MTKPTPEYLRSILSYVEESGLLRWKWRSDVANCANGRFAGKIAGTLNCFGYWQIKINRQIFRSHNIIWAMQTGSWPKIEIDHRDLDTQNNRWNNLREATLSQNKANTGKRAHSRQPFKGAYAKGSRWRAYISVEKKRRYLGSFATPEEAHRAYMAAARVAFGDFARAN